MKIQYLSILTLISLLGINLFGKDVPLDNHFFSVMNLALDTQGRTVMSLGDKETNAEALYLLEVKASKTPDIDNVVRLSLIVSADEAFERYLRSIPRPSTELANFSDSRNATNAVSLLEDSLEMLDHIAKSLPINATLDVMPPTTPGIAEANGMDPNDIPDPKVREEYERRIAENKQVLEEIGLQTRLKNAVVGLKDALKFIVREKEAAQFKLIINSSKLSAETKAKILGQ